MFKRDVWALDQQAPLTIQRLRAVLGERRALDAQRALTEQRGQDAQGGSRDSDPLVGSA